MQIVRRGGPKDGKPIQVGEVDFEPGDERCDYCDGPMLKERTPEEAFAGLKEFLAGGKYKKAELINGVAYYDFIGNQKCKTCELPADESEKCGNCSEVEKRLLRYLDHENGREFVHRAFCLHDKVQAEIPTFAEFMSRVQDAEWVLNNQGAFVDEVIEFLGVTFPEGNAANPHPNPEIVEAAYANITNEAFRLAGDEGQKRLIEIFNRQGDAVDFKSKLFFMLALPPAPKPPQLWPTTEALL